MSRQKKASGPITLAKLQRGCFKAYIMGDTPLIVHAWSKKAITEMLAKQMGQKLPRFPKSPVEDFLASIYRTENGEYGFPATAIKRAMVETCTSMSKEITKVAARQAIYIPAKRGWQQSAFSGLLSPIELLELYSPMAPIMREDMVRLNGKTPDIRYRAEFWPWALRFEILFNTAVVSDATIAALIDTAGFACGLGEWRQERCGVNGQFRLATAAEQKQIDAWAKKGSVAPKLPDEKAFILKLQEDIRKYGEASEDEEETAKSHATSENGSRPGKAARQ
jgi:hypothetical protein